MHRWVGYIAVGACGLLLGVLVGAVDWLQLEHDLGTAALFEALVTLLAVALIGYLLQRRSERQQRVKERLEAHCKEVIEAARAARAVSAGSEPGQHPSVPVLQAYRNFSNETSRLKRLVRSYGHYDGGVILALQRFEGEMLDYRQLMTGTSIPAVGSDREERAFHELLAASDMLVLEIQRL